MYASAFGTIFAAALVGLSAAACGGSTGPGADVSLPGVWRLVGYSEHGLAAEAVSGTMTFATDGTFRTDATIRYPGEADEPLSASGTWEHDAASNRLTLSTTDGRGVWEVSMAHDTLVLTLTNDPEALPPNVLRLQR